jgi:hypothetical protein
MSVLSPRVIPGEHRANPRDAREGDPGKDNARRQRNFLYAFNHRISGTTWVFAHCRYELPRATLRATLAGNDSECHGLV